MWSFDVFDTCLVRRHALPTDVFLKIARRLEKTLKPVLGTDYAEIFREIRTSAEGLALKKSGAEETTLNMIWQEVNRLIPELEIEKGLSAEIEVEAESLVPVASNLERVAEARRQFGKVIFISDSYLPEDFITEQLRLNGYFHDGDICFVSSSLLKTKRSGTLYDEVLSTLKVPAKSLTHHGDNYQSDIHVARIRGINAIHITETALNFRERKVGQQLQYLCPAKTSELVGVMRASRLTTSCVERKAAVTLVSQFIGPLLWILADWLLSRALQDGIKKLYFCSRDCHGLYKTADILAKRRGLEIECRYLMVSRQALLLPSVQEISPEGMPWLRRSWEKGKLSDLAAKLDIDVALIERAMARDFPGINSDSRLATDEQWSSFWRALNNPLIKKTLTEVIEARRKTALDYFQQEELFQNKKTALVDLGWHQSVQKAMTMLLKTIDPSIIIFGYFLALVDNRSAYIKGMPAQALFHRAPYDRRSTFFDGIVYSRIGLLEHILNCAPHGTVHHYETNRKEGITIAKCIEVSREEIHAKDTLLRELEDFADKQIRALDFKDPESRAAFSAVLSNAVINPDNAWREIALAIEVADDQNNSDRTRMIKPRSFSTALSDLFLLRDLKRIRPDDLGVWPELSLQSTDQKLLSGYRAVGVAVDLMRLIRRKVFSKKAK
jgi:predicted HAD superfamily hydrolase